MEITELQKDLAATFRWTARLNMHEGVANHFSACVPGSSTDFYVNKAGIHFSQIKASDLILVTKENINDLKNITEEVYALYPTVGENLDFIQNNNLKNIKFLYRKLDQFSWQYCNKGFFNFKNYIPKIIAKFN